MNAGEWSVSGLHVAFSRRRFVLGIGAGAVGVATAALVPVASARAVAPGLAAAGEPVEAVTVDDVWGAPPHYSAPIGFGRPQLRTRATVSADGDPQLAAYTG